MLLDAESEQYLVVNTHRGRYKYHRLAYGVLTAPAISQKTMEQILHRIPNVVCFLDDILVTAPTMEKHIAVLEKAMSRLEDCGVRLKGPKCEFLKEAVEYLGFKIEA